MTPADPFGRLYVIEIDTRSKRSRIKVGYTRSPDNRLRTHRSSAQAHGCRPGEHYLSPAGSGTWEREDELIEFCKEQRGARQYRREYFGGVSFAAVVQFAAHLCRDAAWHHDRLIAAVRHHLPPGRALCSFEEAAQCLSTTEGGVQVLVATGLLRVVHFGARTKRVPVIDIEGLFQDPQPHWLPRARSRVSVSNVSAGQVPPVGFEPTLEPF